MGDKTIDNRVLELEQAFDVFRKAADRRFDDTDRRFDVVMEEIAKKNVKKNVKKNSRKRGVRGSKDF